MAKVSTIILLLLLFVCGVLSFLYYNAHSTSKELEARTYDLQVSDLATSDQC